MHLNNYHERVLELYNESVVIVFYNSYTLVLLTKDRCVWDLCFLEPLETVLEPHCHGFLLVASYFYRNI